MHNPGRGIRLRSNALTNTGKVRENNEDNVFLWHNELLTLAIVADGMGGAVAGEEASRIAVETIHTGLLDNNINSEKLFENLSADIISDKLRDIIRTANANIVQKTLSSPELKGMGTTVTMALVKNDYAVIGHVGDSRAYLVDGNDGSISQITSDHSFVEAMVAAGHITREEAEDHPMKNVLYRALGQSDEIDVDVYHSYLRVGDRLVICSDGLTLHVKPNEIAELSLKDEDPQVTSRRLVELANERGGKDNVTVVVINVEEDEQQSEDYFLDSETSNVEDETLVLRDRDIRPFVSSESDTSPKLESRDHRSYYFKSKSNQQPKNGLANSSYPSNNIEPIEPFKEGRDLLEPDE